MGHSFRHVLVTLNDDDEPCQWMCIYCQDVETSAFDIGRHLRCHKEEFGLYGDKIQVVVNVSRWNTDQWVSVRSRSLEYACPELPVGWKVTEQEATKPSEDKLISDVLASETVSETGCLDDESVESGFQNLDCPEGRRTPKKGKAEVGTTCTRKRGRKKKNGVRPGRPVGTWSKETNPEYSELSSREQRKDSMVTCSGEKQATTKRKRGRPKGRRVSNTQAKDRADSEVTQSMEGDSRTSVRENESATNVVTPSVKSKAIAKRPREFECGVCGWKSSRHFNYHRHMLSTCGEGESFPCSYCHKEIGRDSSKTNYGLQCRKCPDCGFNFYHLEEYREHLSQGCDSKAPGKLLCLVCRKTFKWSAHLESHIVEAHLDSGSGDAEKHISDKMGRVQEGSEESKQYLCSVCDWSSDVHYNYHRHSCTHTDNQSFQCVYCDKHISPEKFRIKKKTKIKNERTDSVQPGAKKKTVIAPSMVCEHCGFTTTRRDIFTKHQVEHIPEHERDVHRCDLCSYETFYASSLRTHMAAKHDKKEKIQLTPDMVLCCELCGSYTGDSREVIMAHKRSSCPYRDTHITMLKAIEEISGNTEATATEQKRESFERRIKVANPMQAGRSKKWLNPKKKNKMKVFVCDYCDFVCLRRWNMVRHKQCQHQRTAIECHLCGYTTKYIPWLCAHYRKIHSSEPPSDLVTLMEQMKASQRRTKFIDREKPKRLISKKREMCHQCGKYVIASSIKRHLAVSHGDRSQRKSYKCSWKGCLYQTTVYSYLARHTNRVHRRGRENKKIKKPVHTCESCGFKASTHRGLLEHRKAAHASSPDSGNQVQPKPQTAWPVGQTPSEIIHQFPVLSQLPIPPTGLSAVDYMNLLAASKTPEQAVIPQQNSATGHQAVGVTVGNLPSLIDVAPEHRLVLADNPPTLQNGDTLDFHKQF